VSDRFKVGACFSETQCINGLQKLVDGLSIAAKMYDFE